MPYKIAILDEYGDIIMQDYEIEERIPKKKKRNLSKEIERYILLIAQKARAAGIHIIISTQRPSTDVIKGTIKANFPTKVLLRTAKAVDSQVVIDDAGGELLLGKGDMIFVGDKGQERLQGYKNA